MARNRLTDEQWELIADHFPPPATLGRPQADRRNIFDGILWIVRTGAPWRDLPEEFGPWQTVYHHFNDWSSNGLLHEILSTLMDTMSEDGAFDHELWSIDGTIVRAARCAAGGGKRGIRRSLKTTH